MKTQTRQFSHVEQHQQMDSPPTTMTEYLTIIRNFILEMHQRVNQEFDPQVLPSNLTSIIDRAAVKLKTNKEQLSMMEKENRDLENTKIAVTQLKAQQAHMEKRFGQKNDQISILRETVKTLYGDNQRLNAQKQKLNKELVSSKQSCAQMKKKLKKQEEEMTKHKQELQKLTKIAEERLGEYASEDKEKHKSIKKLTQENEKLKAENQKVSKLLDDAKRQIEELSKIKVEHQANIKFIDALKYENDMCKKEKQSLIESLEQKTKRFTEEVTSLRNQLSQECQKTLSLSISLKQLEMTYQSTLTKLKTYQEDIAIRTQKLKEKNDQIHKYDQEITKLVERIETLSEMSNQVMKENEMLGQRCEILEERLEEGRIVQEYVQKIKGEINYSKSMELGKLIEGLGSIRGRI